MARWFLSTTHRIIGFACVHSHSDNVIRYILSMYVTSAGCASLIDSAYWSTTNGYQHSYQLQWYPTKSTNAEKQFHFKCLFLQSISTLFFLSHSIPHCLFCISLSHFLHHFRSKNMLSLAVLFSSMLVCFAAAQTSQNLTIPGSVDVGTRSKSQLSTSRRSYFVS